MTFVLFIYIYTHMYKIKAFFSSPNYSSARKQNTTAYWNKKKMRLETKQSLIIPTGESVHYWERGKRKQLCKRVFCQWFGSAALTQYKVQIPHKHMAHLEMRKPSMVHPNSVFQSDGNTGPSFSLISRRDGKQILGGSLFQSRIWHSHQLGNRKVPGMLLVVHNNTRRRKTFTAGKMFFE